MNLFIAIIVDAFLGQSDHFKLPVQKYSIKEFTNIWSKYDNQATGYIEIEDLESLIIDMANSFEGRELIVMHERVLADEKFRMRFMAMLQIPTYNQLRQVMFYDTLQQLCHLKHI